MSEIWGSGHGTETLRPPKGWKSSVTENELYTNVGFISEGNASIGFNIIKNGEDGKRYTAEEYVAGEVDTQYQKMLKKSPITISGASGYVTEKTQTFRTGTMHTKLFTLLKNGKVYQIGGGASEENWTAYEPLLDASL